MKFVDHVPRPWRIFPLFQSIDHGNQQRADKWSLGIWQIWIRPVSEHLLGPVYN